MKPHVHSHTAVLRNIALVAIALLAAGAAQGQESQKQVASPPKPAAAGGGVTGPTDQAIAAVDTGMVAPDFELQNANDRAVKLSSRRGDWVALVFFDRVAPAADLAAIDHELRKMGVRLVAVCHEKTGAVHSRVQRDGLEFEILSDASGEVGAMYGLQDLRTRQALPGFFLLDRRGNVKVARPRAALSPSEIREIARATLSGA